MLFQTLDQSAREFLDLLLQQGDCIQLLVEDYPLQAGHLTAQGGGELLLTGPHTRIGQLRQAQRVTLARRQRPQHAPAAQTKQIAQKAADLDPARFQQDLHLIADAIQLPGVFHARAGQHAPFLLARLRYEAQDEFTGRQPACEACGIGEIHLPPRPRSIGLRLRQKQLEVA